jgi:hypothetical protein
MNTFDGRTKSIIFRTVVVRTRNNWTKRISDLLVPNASHIRTLVINSVFIPLSDEELSHIRRLLEASEQVVALAVAWNIWTHFSLECGVLQLESLYFMWDPYNPVPTPSLKNLRHPSKLKDLTVYAPAYRNDATSFRSVGELYLPTTANCVNLAYVTYAADRTPIPTVGSICEVPHIKGALFVLVNIPERFLNEEDESTSLLQDDKDRYPNFSTAYLPRSYQVLGQWLAKMEGRPSILAHPPPHAVMIAADDDDTTQYS